VRYRNEIPLQICGGFAVSIRSETLMSGVMAMSFDGEELGERSISTHDIIVTDVSVIQFDVSLAALPYSTVIYDNAFNKCCVLPRLVKLLLF